MKKPSSGMTAGIYITVIIHLTVIIVLMSAKVVSIQKKESSFVLDFTAQEELERIEKELAFKGEISRQLQDMIEQAEQNSPARNIVVNRGALKDDRGTDAEQLYKDAERLANDLKQGQNAVHEDARNETVDLNPDKSGTPRKSETYTGPSVISYTLDGRTAVHLKIPAYTCLGGGDVTVRIAVDQKGNVTDAKIVEELSSTDHCLLDYAKRAARMSKFSASASAPSRQYGEIVYRFIAQ